MNEQTPKEKAKELVAKYINLTEGWVYGTENWKHKKQCALIAVNEIILANPHSNPFNTDVYSTMGYWQQVKNEIESL
jgi:hypothetical protein